MRDVSGVIPLFKGKPLSPCHPQDTRARTGPMRFVFFDMQVANKKCVLVECAEDPQLLR